MTFQTIFSFRKTYKPDIETQLDTQKLGNMSLQILRKDENEMAKKEVKTDLWVARQLDDSKIKYDAQGSDVKLYRVHQSEVLAMPDIRSMLRL